MTRPRRRFSLLRLLARRRHVLLSATAMTALATACVPLFHQLVIEEVEVQAVTRFTTPARAYLRDGSIVVLPEGGFVAGGLLYGSGNASARYALTLDQSSTTTPFGGVTVDSVMAIETFRTENVSEGQSAALATLSVAAFAVIIPLAAVAIFGSCPTIYGVVDGEEALQMEAFSFSIAPLFESRDIERLTVEPDASGAVHLELRNEALETHYINQMELLQVTHDPRELVTSDASGRPILVSSPKALSGVTDRYGRDVLALVRSADGVSFRSSRERLSQTTPTDFRDHLDLAVPVPDGADEIALVFRIKNTLLNSVLFYDVMLGRSGVAGLDWLGRDLDRIGTALDMATWYHDTMGIKVFVEDDGRLREVAYIPDAGPVAWSEVAVVVPARGPEARVRIEFVTDSWFFDQMSVASDPRFPGVRRVPLSALVGPDGSLHAVGLDRLADSDDDYLVTRPGERYGLEFQLPDEPTGRPRTLLLAAEGYYVEWIRGHWITDEGGGRPFVPGDPALVEAMHRWNEVMEEFERDFFSTRIQVR